MLGDLISIAVLLVWGAFIATIFWASLVKPRCSECQQWRADIRRHKQAIRDLKRNPPTQASDTKE